MNTIAVSTVNQSARKAANGYRALRGALLLNHLVKHCTDRSNKILLITGPPNTGKSWLCQLLSERLGHDTHVLRLQGLQFTRGDEVLKAVAASLGDATTPGEGLSTKFALRKRLEAVGDTNPALTILVDDAEVPEPEAMEELVNLAAVTPLQLVFFGHPRILGFTRQAARFSRLSIHEVHTNSSILRYAGEFVWSRLRKCSKQFAAALATPTQALLTSVTRWALVGTALTCLLVVGWWTTSTRIEPAEVLTEPVISPTQLLVVPAVAAKPVAAPLVPQVNPIDAKPALNIKSNAVAPDKPVRLMYAQRDSEWLLQQPPEKYTIQIITLYSQGQVHAFIAGQQGQDPFGAYEVVRKGVTYHAVIYGLYDTYDQATAVLNSLPPGIDAVQPVVRSVKMLQRNIRLGRSNNP